MSFRVTSTRGDVPRTTSKYLYQRWYDFRRLHVLRRFTCAADLYGFTSRHVDVETEFYMLVYM